VLLEVQIELFLEILDYQFQGLVPASLSVTLTANSFQGLLILRFLAERAISVMIFVLPGCAFAYGLRRPFFSPMNIVTPAKNAINKNAELGVNSGMVVSVLIVIAPCSGPLVLPCSSNRNTLNS
jgi:hypothetical protein